MMTPLIPLTASATGPFSDPAGSPSRTATMGAGVSSHLLDPLNRGVHAVNDGEGPIDPLHCVSHESVGEKRSVEISDVVVFSNVV